MNRLNCSILAALLIAGATGASLALAQPAPKFSKTYQLSWQGTDLDALETLAIQHTRGIKIVQNPEVRELSLFLQIDSDDSSDRALLEFQRRIRAGSKMNGRNPTITIPPDECEQLADLGRGLCTHDLMISLPTASKLEALELQLAWRQELTAKGIDLKKLKLMLGSATSARLDQVNADIEAISDGPGARLMMNGVEILEFPFVRPRL